MGGSNELELTVLFLVLLPGLLVVTFPETWVALIGSFMAGLLGLRVGPAAGAAVAIAAYIVVRILIAFSGADSSMATANGFAFAGAGALVVTVLFVVGYCLGRLVSRLVD